MGYEVPDMPMMFRMATGMNGKDKSPEDEVTEVNYGVDI